MWECGLKQFFALLASMAVERSLLMWECGLKLFELDPENRKYSHSLCGSVDWNKGYKDTPKRKNAVTPYVGVWIETDDLTIVAPDFKSLLMWECGLKLQQCLNTRFSLSHSLCGSVDWNLRNWLRPPTLIVSLLMWECGLKRCEYTGPVH